MNNQRERFGKYACDLHIAWEAFRSGISFDEARAEYVLTSENVPQYWLNLAEGIHDETTEPGFTMA